MMKSISYQTADTMDEFKMAANTKWMILKLRYNEVVAWSQNHVVTLIHQYIGHGIDMV